MNLVKKYKQWKDVPVPMQEAYREDRYKVVIPNTKAFRIAVIDWTQVDWVNYICMKGRMWSKRGRDLKL